MGLIWSEPAIEDLPGIHLPYLLSPGAQDNSLSASQSRCPWLPLTGS